MAINLTEEEKQLLASAKKLRQIVKADIEKTENPALAALVRVLGPTLLKNPKVGSATRSIPPQAWRQVAQHVVRLVSQTANSKSASSTPTTAHIIAAVGKTLTAAGMKDAESIANEVVMASAEAVSAHQKSYNPKLAAALERIARAQTEISLLREFV